MSIFDERALPSACTEDDSLYEKEKEQITEEEKTDESIENNEVYELPENISDRNRIWSIISLIAGALSIILSPIIAILSIIFASVGISLAVYSRKRFGFFTRLTLVGMMVSMIGAVCGISFAIAGAFGIF